MVTVEELQELLSSGGDVVGPDGRTIGSVGELFLDAATGRPAWVTVPAGLFGSGEALVPLAGATVRDGALHVAHDRSQVRHAPRVPVTDGAVGPEDERLLLRHYGLLPDEGADQGTTPDDGTPDDGTPHDAPFDAAPGDARVGDARGDDAPVPPPTVDAPPPPPRSPGDLDVAPGSELDPGPDAGRDAPTGDAAAATPPSGGPGRPHGRHADPGRTAEDPPAS